MLIGVSGKKRSGKDTFFELLKKYLPDNYIVNRYSFADGVREFAETYFNIPQKYWLDDSFKEDNRFILQGIGQMMREEHDRNFWVSQVIKKYKYDILSEVMSKHLKGGVYEAPKLIGVVTDVRYENEATMIENMDDSILLRIERPGFVAEDSHPSETSLDDYRFNHVLVNNDDLETYERRVSEWIQNKLLSQNP